MRFLLHAALGAVLVLGAASVCSARDAATAEPDSTTAVNRLLFGINCAWPMRNQPLDSPALVSALKALHPGMLRFPGGTLSSFWDTGAGRFVPDEDISRFGFQRWTGMYTKASHDLSSAPKDRFSPQAFDRLCKEVGAEPCWTLNFATLPGEHEAQTIRKMCADGLRLQCVEMGNEYDVGLFKKVLPTVDDYIEKTRPALKALRECPGAGLVAYVASTVELGDTQKAEKARQRSDTRLAEWATNLFKYRSLYDAWVVHFYGVGLNLVTAVGENERASAVLSWPQKVLTQRAAIVRRNYGGVPLWLTEYNIAFHGLNREDVDTTSPAARFLAAAKNSGLHALTAAAHLLSVVENHDIYKTACYHSLAGMDGFAILKFDAESPNSPCRVNAAAQVFAHISAVSAQSTQMGAVRIENNPPLPLSGELKDAKALQAVCFRSELRLSYIILNRSCDSVPIELKTPDGFARGSATSYTADKDPKPLEWIKLPADAADRYPWPGPIKPLCSTVTVKNGSAAVDVPALSLMIVTLE